MKLNKQESEVYLTPFKVMVMDDEWKHTTLKNKANKHLWTQEEDQMLIKAVEKVGAKEWAKIAQYIPNRCGKQCRQRWHNHLRKGVNKHQWTRSQQWMLMLYVRAYGRKWSFISKQLQNRTDNTIKNHWNCKMKSKKQYYSNRIDHYLNQLIMGNTPNLTNIQHQLLTIIMNHVSVNPYFNSIKEAIEQVKRMRNQNNYTIRQLMLEDINQIMESNLSSEDNQIFFQDQ